jgi:hypothetical protein
MTARRRLPNRRRAETFDIEVAGLKYKALSRNADGTASGVIGAALDAIAERER